MKSRRIIPRKTYLTRDLFSLGKLYRPEKIDGKILSEHDFWFNALVWIREQDEDLGEIGMLRAGDIAAIIKGKLYPSVNFDDNFKFLEVSKTILEANICRQKSISYTKQF